MVTDYKTKSACQVFGNGYSNFTTPPLHPPGDMQAVLAERLQGALLGAHQLSPCGGWCAPKRQEQFPLDVGKTVKVLHTDGSCQLGVDHRRSQSQRPGFFGRSVLYHDRLEQIELRRHVVAIFELGHGHPACSPGPSLSSSSNRDSLPRSPFNARRSHSCPIRSCSALFNSSS
eukprot:scpid101438/ scgid13140/ 